MYVGVGKDHWGKKVPDNEAYEYAKAHLDEMDDRDKQLFVEFFFSGCWVREEDKDAEEL